jgi:hypothetical protein
MASTRDSYFGVQAALPMDYKYDLVGRIANINNNLMDHRAKDAFARD